MAGETLVFRRVGFSPTLSLLMPTFSFVAAPPDLTVRLQRNYNAPLPLQINLKVTASVVYLCPIIIHAEPLDQ